MDEMKHTPGPWTFADGLIIANGERLKLIGVQTPMTAGPSRLEAIANARLIAAAPEMLEALGRILQATEDGDEMAAVEMARAAISKATEA